jgi:Zn-dependent protease with chaperone function
VRGAVRLYRVNLALAALGLGVVGLALAGALRSMRFDAYSLDSALSACMGMFPSLDAGGYLRLALAVLAAVSVTLALRSAARQLRSTARYLRPLRSGATPVELAGTECELIDGGQPRALCAGYLRPRIYVSSGAVEALSADELRAVVAHERHHRERRDPLRLLVARTLADALFFLPALRRVSARYAELVELAADEAAIGALGERRTLARALLRFGDLGSPSVAVAAIAPERVDNLIGDPAASRWGLSPARLLASALLGTGLLLAIGFLLAAGDPAPVNLFLILAQSCALMIVAGALSMTLVGGALRRAASRIRGT